MRCVIVIPTADDTKDLYDNNNNNKYSWEKL